MNNECKECQYFGENFYSDDRGYNDNDRINACMLTREGYCEMSYKECHTITNCYYKQLLAEQAKNKKLIEVIDNAIKICNNNIGFACVSNGICGLNALEKVQQVLNEVNK